MRLTARELGVATGDYPTGPWNAITDVPGVQVGQVTLIRGAGKLVAGQGPVRTGVTAIIPQEGDLFHRRVPAGVYILHGQGKCVGLAQVEEFGMLDAPILLTGTQNVWRVAEAALDWLMLKNPRHGIDLHNPNPIVGECYDAYLNDMQGRHVGRGEVFAALDSAAHGPVEQGCVGAGTGTLCYSYKGGIGTSSRRTPRGYTIGCLMQTNFGNQDVLQVLGVPVGRILKRLPPPLQEEPRGSVMVILATDAPLTQRQLERVGKRGSLGLARTGARSRISSGDFFICFSNAYGISYPSDGPEYSLRLVNDWDPVMEDLLYAAVEVTEESVYNSLFCATDMEGRDDHFVPALPVDQVLQLLRDRGCV